MQTRERPRTPAFLPPPVPLPNLTTAFSRRAALLGTVTASPVAPTVARSAIPSRDAWLIEIGEDLAAAELSMVVLEAANPGEWDLDNDPAWVALTARFRALFAEMERMPAITMDGLYAKAKALQIRWVADHATWTGRLSISLAADVRHLCGPAAS